MRAPTEEFRDLDLAVHALLGDVPLHDLNVIDLPGGGPGRTIVDVRALAGEAQTRASPIVRFLFWLRFSIGKLFGWDEAAAAHPEESYLARVGDELRRRSSVAPGSAEGLFRLLYVLPRESLAEIRNATVHAILAQALVETDGGYRLYWAIYVKPVSRLTSWYMAAIEPFRRFVVYPSMLRRIREAWNDRYGAAS